MPRKILHLITDTETGGAQMMLLAMLGAWKVSDLEPMVVSLMEPGEVARAISALGVPVRSVGMTSRIPSPANALTLARILREESPDLIQTWMYHADLIGAGAGMLARVPCVWGIHSSTLLHARASTRLVVGLLARMSSRVPARIVSCSRDAVRAHKELGYAVRNIQMIPNGFDTDLFHPDEQARRSVRDELGLAADALLVGNFGRFTILKDHRTLMRAAAVMLPEDPKLHLVLCGARVDPANAELARWTAETGHGDRILLLGERRDMSRLAAALDVYCSSSSMEAFPLVVGEAMASGVPCVVTDVGDSALLVGGTGRVVPPGDPAALAAAMVSLLAMAPGDRQKLGMTGRVRIIENFGLQGTVDAYLSLYRELLGPA